MFVSLLPALVLGLAGCDATGQSAAQESAAAEPSRSAVTALGRLEPGWGVLDLGAPPGDRIHEMLVVDGDEVAAGDILAVLESHGEREAQVAVRQAQVEEARRHLQREREVGPLAVEARAASVRRLEADLELAVSDLGRTRRLVSDEVVPARESEFQGVVEAQARAALDEARAQLEQERRRQRLAEAEAQAALTTAEALLALDEASLAQSVIRAPKSGAVLDVLVFAGESTDQGAILRLGEVRAMYAVAEVYETDARFVDDGAPAVITSPALPKPLHGTVKQRSRLVHKNDVLGIDPAADTDSRVMEMRILIEEGEVAASFVHLQVDIEIDTSGR